MLKFRNVRRIAEEVVAEQIELLALQHPPTSSRTCPCLSSCSIGLFLPYCWTCIFVLPAVVFRLSSGYSTTLSTCSQRSSLQCVCAVVSPSHINTFQSRSSSSRFLLTAVSPPPLAQPPLERPLISVFFLFFLALVVAVVFLLACYSAGPLVVCCSHPPSVSRLPSLPFWFSFPPFFLLLIHL